MKLIESKVEILENKDAYQMIELAGRTCYKSEDMITADSAKEFVDRMIKLGHGAMLEHGTIYLTIEKDNGNIPPAMLFWKEGKNQKYSRVSRGRESGTLYVTTNLRVLVERSRVHDLVYQCEPTEYHEKRISVKFTCDRGVSHEFVRHRVFSFAQESTRYCNYSKDKFGNELTFITPSWLKLPVGNYTYWDGDWCDIERMKIVSADADDTTPINAFLASLSAAERTYNILINSDLKPQQARQVLPNALKTELVMTGFASDWEGFFKLRCAGSAHPDAKKLADELKELMVK